MSLKKIAELTGVSVATVSRVLNNPDYKCKDDKLRSKIWNTAVSINYFPNEFARKLRSGEKDNNIKKYYVNILLTRSDGVQSDPFFDELLRVVETQIHSNMLILSKIWHNSCFSSNKKSDREKANIEIEKISQEISDKNDGLIIIGRCSHEAVKKLKNKFKNIVSVNRNSTNYEVDEVLCDGTKIAKIAMEHLFSLGHTSIAYVGECRNEAKFEGYMSEMKKHDCEVFPENVFDVAQTETDGYAVMEKVLAMEERPTAFFCANDITAIGMIKCLNHKKNRYYIPSIISSDNIDEGQFTQPMLTTVNLSKDDMGRFAVNLLLDRIKGGHKNIVRLEIESNLIIRSSTATVDEANVAEYYI